MSQPAPTIDHYCPECEEETAFVHGGTRYFLGEKTEAYYCPKCLPSSDDLKGPKGITEYAYWEDGTPADWRRVV